MSIKGLCLAALLAPAGCGGGSNGPPVSAAVVRDTLGRVEGRVRAFRRGPSLSFDADGRVVASSVAESSAPVAVEGVVVRVYSPGGAFLGEAVTRSGGQYGITVNFGPVPATPVTIQVLAQANSGLGSKLRVLPSAGAAEPYIFSAPALGDPNAPTLIANVEIPLASNAGAFNIAQMGRSSRLATLNDVDVIWSEGNGAVSSVTVQDDLGVVTVAGGIAGDDASNTDEFDDPVLARLFGELTFAFVTTDVAPEGTLNGALMVPSVAYREGLLDFWSCIVRDTPLYWDTEGKRAEARVTRFFNIGSFFDPALGSLGPDDPNVYQDPSVIGIGSRFSVAEIMWDIHNSLGIPLFSTIDALEQLTPGATYPHIVTLFESYGRLGLLGGLLPILLVSPEDQGIPLPPTAANGSEWPTRFPNAAAPGTSLQPPFDDTLSDLVDTINPVPLNPDLGLFSQRYFHLKSGSEAHIRLTLTTSGSLRMELLDLSNEVLASGTSSILLTAAAPGEYVVRVLGDGVLQIAPFDLRLELLVP